MLLQRPRQENTVNPDSEPRCLQTVHPGNQSDLDTIPSQTFRRVGGSIVDTLALVTLQTVPTASTCILSSLVIQSSTWLFSGPSWPEETMWQSIGPSVCLSAGLFPRNSLL